jgi:hypothetical protein
MIRYRKKVTLVGAGALLEYVLSEMEGNARDSQRTV